jgi:hypothetical protein
MQQLVVRATAIVCGALFCLPAGAAIAQAPPTRHLVYDFTVGVANDDVKQNNAAQWDGMSTSPEVVNGPGYDDKSLKATDKGQIMVDVNGVQSDGGLMVTVSETARTNRSQGPVTCVVYADTRELCSVSDVQPEEQAVLRALSPKFFDANALDANHHWQVSHGTSKTDFTADPGTDGVSVAITSERVQNATNGSSVVVHAKYAYDTAKRIPTSMTEYQTMRQQNGAGEYSTVIVDTTATLVSDSGIAKI